MKHSLLVLIIVALNVNAQWVNIYKRGLIELIPDTTFAKKTQWDDILYNPVEGIAITQDGTIFMTQSHHHRIHIVTPSGDLSRSFSQKGEGPGDVYHPGDPSILDNKYLVVGEYAERHRISIFDLSGKFVKIVKTKTSPFQPIALKNNKIAYISYQYSNPNKIEKIKSRKELIYIKDIHSGIEKIVAEIETIQRFTIVDKVSLGISYSDFVMISSTLDNNLLVCSTNRDYIVIFDENGKQIKTIPLKLKPVPVTNSFIGKVKERLLADLEKNEPEKTRTVILKLYRNAPFSDFFGSTLPLYSWLCVDSDGNILIFKQKTEPGNKDDFFQVYSPDGNFICETQIKWGMYYPANLSRGNGFYFTKNGIIGIFESDTEDDTLYKLIKLNTR